jgi:hypothetical protein
VTTKHKRILVVLFIASLVALSLAGFSWGYGEDGLIQNFGW